VAWISPRWQIATTRPLDKISGMRRYATYLVTRPVALALLLAAAAVAFLIIEVSTISAVPSLDSYPLSTTVSLAACTSVLVMRRVPWIVMASALVVVTLDGLLGASSPMQYILVAVGSCSVANWGRGAPLTVILSGVLTAAGAFLSPLVGSSNADFYPEVVLYNVVLMVLVASLSVAIGLAARHQQQIMTQLRSQHEQLALLAQLESDAAVIIERTRIARELHDVVAHHVSALLIQANAGQLLAERTGSPDAQRWRSVTEVARETLHSMRRLVGLLRRSDDHAIRPNGEHDPQPRLANLGELTQFMVRSGLEVQLTAPAVGDSLPADLQLATYRIIQEALTNVLRHASATRAVVDIAVVGDELTVDVSDDGRVDSAFRAGTGLLGMRERVASFGGRLDVHARPGQGLRVHAVLPLMSSVTTAQQ
jgi:signal transduction histidine kinase